MKTRTLYRIGCFDGEICAMSGWGESPSEAVEDFRKKVLIEIVDREREKVAWKDNMAVVLNDAIKELKIWMDHYLDSYTVYYETFKEEYDEDRGEWVTASGKARGNFNLKYPIKRTF